MSDEPTKSIEDKIEVPVVEPELTSGSTIEPITEPTLEVPKETESISEPELVVIPDPIPKPETITPAESIPESTASTTNQTATPSQAANTTNQTATPSQAANTTKQEAFSSNPKLNAAALAFISYMGRTKETLALANKARKAQMMKRVYRVMDLFKRKSKIKNDDVEKFIHTDDSTATKYLNILVKEGKIKKSGKIHAPIYTKTE